MPSAYEGTDIIMSAANNKVPGYPLEIFDFVSGSGSYIIFAKQIYHTACCISYRVSDISLKNTRFYDNRDYEKYIIDKQLGSERPILVYCIKTLFEIAAETKFPKLHQKKHLHLQVLFSMRFALRRVK